MLALFGIAEKKREVKRNSLARWILHAACMYLHVHFYHIFIFFCLVFFLSFFPFCCEFFCCCCIFVFLSVLHYLVNSMMLIPFIGVYKCKMFFFLHSFFQLNYYYHAKKKQKNGKKYKVFFSSHLSIININYKYLRVSSTCVCVCIFLFLVHFVLLFSFLG